MRATAAYRISTADVILEPLIDGILIMKNRITVDPNVHFGKPCVTGTRIPVLNVLELVKEGVSFQQITEDYYPGLGTDDVRACLQDAIEVVTVEDLHISTQA